MTLRTKHALTGLSPEETERWFYALSHTVALDFDGTLHPYTNGWTGSTPDNEPPIPGSRTFINQLLSLGYQIVIFSVRADHEEGRVGIEQWLAKWYGVEIAGQIRVTHEKPPAIAYVDDRAVVFTPEEPNWDECLSGIELLADGRPHGTAGNGQSR